LNKPIREGFVEDDKPVEFHATEGPRVQELAGPAPAEASAPEPAEANAPPPLDLNAPPPTVQWPVTLKLLYKPTRNTKNEVIHALLLRAPTARDIMQCGIPARLATNGDVIADPDAMTRMLAALSDVYPPLIEALDARDWVSCAFFLQRFFLPNSATWAPPTTS
jgi:hypothetical protein